VDFIERIVGLGKMKTPEIIDFVSIQDISDNISLYKDILVRDGIFVFRNANLSHEDHTIVSNKINELLGIHNEGDFRGYVENHSETTKNMDIEFGPDDIMLPWHIEHPTQTNPIVLATWNMHKFTTNEENGKTYFVNSKLLYKEMPDDLKDFLGKCVMEDDVALPGEEKTHSVIHSHWITGEPVIRTSFIYSGENQILSSVNGEAPSKDNRILYGKAMYWIRKQLYDNPDIRIVHRWKQGDLVIPDMFVMYHAVTGGFTPDEREFVGIWSRRDKNKEKQNGVEGKPW
jgi:alpha-ketoglutarate-dependent taurine dioxygenase